jgi:hypothetical protein
MYCFTLLQNSVDFDQFNENLSDIYTIFNSEFCNASFNLSLKTLRECIINRKLHQFGNSPKTFSDQKERDFIHKIKVKDEESNKVYLFSIRAKIKQESPFTKYFETKISNFKLKVVQDSDNNEKMNLERNLLYLPAIFKIIENFLHILPLWSGLMISSDLIKLNFEIASRLSNTGVENWFHNLRNNILKISKKDKTKNRLMPSQLIAIEFKYIQMTYETFYPMFIASELEKESSKNLKKQKLASNETEKWSFSKRNSDFKREKGKYLESIHNLGRNLNAIEKNINKISTSEFETLFNSSIIYIILFLQNLI